MRVFSTQSGKRHILPMQRLSCLCLGSGIWLSSFHLAVFAQNTYLGPTILPPVPGAIDGGNPFQGLGRSDDPLPSREKQFGFPTYNSSSFNANGMQDSPPPDINSDGYADYRNTNTGNSGNGGYSDSTGTTGGQAGNSAPNNLPAGFIPSSMLDSPPINAPTHVQAPAPPFKEQATVVPNIPTGFAGEAGFGNILPADNNINDNVNTAAPTRTPIPPGSQQGSAGSGTNTTAPMQQQNGSLPTAQKSQSIKSDQNDSGSKSSFSDSMGSIFDKDVSTGQPGSGSSSSSSSSSSTGSIGSSGSTGSSGSSGSSGLSRSASSPNQSKSNDDNAPDEGDSKNSKLVPPPPATSLLSGGGGRAGEKALSSSPLGTAVEQIKFGRLPDALLTLNTVLRTDSENANAHYLKAVVLVLSRRFSDARNEYLVTLKYSRSAELTNRARVGLSKLAR